MKAPKPPVLSRSITPSAIALGAVAAVLALCVGYLATRNHWALVLLPAALPLLLVAAGLPMEALFLVCFAVFAGTELAIPGYSLWIASRWVILGLIAAIAVVRYDHSDRMSPRFRWPVLLVALAAMASASYSPQPRLSFVKGLAYLLVYLAYFRGAPQVVARRPELALRLLLAVFVGSVVLSLATLAISPGTAIESSFKGLYRSPNGLGEVLAFTFPAGAYAVIALRRSGRPARWASLLLVIGLVMIVAARARSGWIGVALTILVLAKLFWRIRWPAIAFAGAAVIALLVWLGPTNQSHLITFIQKGDSSILSTRIGNGLWQIPLDGIKARPFLGNGFGTVIGVPDSAGTLVSSAGATPEQDNGPLGIWAQTGVVPFFAMVVFFIEGMGVFVQVVRAGPDVPLAPEVVCLGCVFLTGVADSWFTGWLYAPGNFTGQLFWFSTVCFLALARQQWKRRSALTPDSLGSGGAF